MRVEHLKYIRCIFCGNNLLLEDCEIEDEEIKNGILECRECNEQFPIIRFIPRLLKTSLLKECLIYYYRSDVKSCKLLYNFYKKYLEEKNFKAERSDILKIETLKSFGYEWTKWSKLPEFAENVFWQIMAKEKNFFQGKKGWDPACGMGKDLKNAVDGVGNKGFMIGSDISYSVDSAYDRCKSYKNVLIVQADLYTNFLLDLSFDFTYMVGLVQHLTNPPLGIETVVKKLKKNGYFVATIYHKPEDKLGKIFVKFVHLMRLFTPHLSCQSTVILCRILALPSYLFFSLPYFVLIRFRYVRNLEDAYPDEKVKRRKPDLDYYACNWFDHLKVPIINYYSDGEIMKLFKSRYLKIRKYEHGFIRGVRV